MAGIGHLIPAILLPIMTFDILDHAFEENVTFRANSKQLLDILWDFCMYSCTYIKVLVFCSVVHEDQTLDININTF